MQPLCTHDNRNIIALKDAMTTGRKNSIINTDHVMRRERSITLD